MTNGILKSINKKDKLYKILIQTDVHDTVLFNRLTVEFKLYRATLRKSIREAKRLYFMRTFNMYKSDIKKTWIVINETLNKSIKCQDHNEFIIDNNKINDPNKIANLFNEYFINIGRSLSTQIQAAHDFSEYLATPADTSFKFSPVDENQINNIINNLKNKSSYGYDNISCVLLKKSKGILIKPLTLIINQSMNTGIFPDDLKISKVKPLFKRGDVAQISNYRPISLLPSISKVFEKVIFYQLSEYFNDNELLCCEQFGFRSGHSTELAALRLVDHLVKQMDSYNTPINIYIDLSKAFDTLDHDILLAKLNYYGICGTENALFRSYLSNRLQYVDYQGSQSALQLISTGVPQGSVLGPLLFIIYINDLPLVSNIFEMLMYADDTTLYCNLNQNVDEKEINKELNLITEWLTSNKLSLNVQKTKFIVFHTDQRVVNYPTLQINNTIIERVTQFNFLGLILSSNLKWHKHINYISIKISRVIGIMYRLKQTFPQEVLLTIYNSLIVPHFNYCLLAWGLKVVEGHSIHLFQKKALRIITDNDFIAHSEPICKQLHLVKVTDMYKIAIWKFYYKLMNNILPSYFNIMKPVLPVVCAIYEIRKPTFHLPPTNHAFAEQLMKYQVIKTLNDEHGSMITASKVLTHSFYGFKLFLKNKFIESYADHIP